MSKKCIAIHLPVDLIDKINEEKAKTGQSQSGLIIDLIEKGLGFSSNDKTVGKLFFFVKVRIDTTKMMEFGQKLQNGEIDTSHTIMTYCIKDDPTVGLNFWYADTIEEFEKVLAQYRTYYKEIIETIQVITPMSAMKLIMENMKKQ
jgi:Ribbon-helix-helix protein, copG family